MRKSSTTYVYFYDDVTENLLRFDTIDRICTVLQPVIHFGIDLAETDTTAVLPVKNPNANEGMPAEKKEGLLDQDPIPEAKKTYRCGKCGENGHTRATCTYGNGKTHSKEEAIDLLSKKEYADVKDCQDKDLSITQTGNEMNIPYAEITKAYKSKTYEEYFSL